MDHDRVLTALLSTPSIALVGAAPDGSILLWSAGAEQMFGWTAAEALGRPVSMLIPPDRSEEMSRRLATLDGEAQAPLETVRLARDGSQVPTEMHVITVYDGHGLVVGTAGVHRDLRRARRAETALTASHDELRAIFAESPVAQARVDLTGRVLVTNAAMRQLLGRSDQELVGQDALDMFVVEDRAELEQALARLASGAEQYVQQERTLVRADGARRSVIMTLTVVRGTAGELMIAGSVEDVTDLREAEERVREQAARFDALLTTMPVTVFTYDRDGRCTSSRGRALERLGEQDDQLVGTSLTDPAVVGAEVSRAVRASLDGQEQQLVLDLAGRVWDCHYRPRRSGSGDLVGGIGIALDITERAAAERAVRAHEVRMGALLAHASDVVLVLDETGRIVYVSPSAKAQLGYDEAELFWRDSYDTFNRAEDREVLTAAWTSILSTPGASVRVEARFRHGDGSWRWAEHVLTNLLHESDVAGIVINVEDITERRTADEELRRLALHDPLTGLPNRSLILDRIGQAMAWNARERRQSGVVVLGVSGMATVNDALGQEGGDLVLCSIAGRLLEAVRDTDSVARVGGDRFAVLVEDVASAEELRARAATLIDAVEGPGDLPGADIHLRFRVGSAMTPAAGAGALLTAAERAMSASLGGDHSVAVVPGGESDVHAEATRELRAALERGELCLHFQPVVDLQDGTMAGAEVLVRWQHPQRGLLSAADIIPLAETSDLILDIGSWVLREACRHAAAWQAAGHTFGVGINLSPRQMVDPRFGEVMRRVLRETGARGDGLVLEVTESAVMDVPAAVEVLADLRSLGMRLALDDFGTGYSSLTYLRRFPVDAIKIDRSFVAGIGRNTDDEAIVASVVSLGRAVGKMIVAEGVETALQAHALQSLGVEQAQGYLWSAALPPDDLLAWMADSARRDPMVPVPKAVPAPARATAPPQPEDEPQILQLHAEGASLHTIAAVLNAEGKRTAEGRRWTTTTVARVVAAAVRRP